MNRAERHLEILHALEEAGQVGVGDIVESLGVSLATARRDLDDLAQDLLLTRTHGGAVAASVAYQLPAFSQVSANAREKKAIAHAASSMVRPGMTIALTGGTTCAAIAAMLAARTDLAAGTGHPGLTVVTNAINIAAALAMRPHIRTVMTGGIVRSNSYNLAGPFADSVIDNVMVDLAFIGVDGVCHVSGPTMKDPDDAGVSSRVVRQSRTVSVVADSTKIGQHSFARVSGIDQFTLITDVGITDDQRREFSDAGTDVITT